MKKTLVLAPAVALAITGLSAPFAFAATPTSTPSNTSPADEGAAPEQSAAPEAAGDSASDASDQGSAAAEGDAEENTDEPAPVNEPEPEAAEPEATEEPDNSGISPDVSMPYPLTLDEAQQNGIPVTITTAPNAEVDVSKISLIANEGHTLELEDKYDGTADEEGNYTFTLSPEDVFSSSFDESRNTEVQDLEVGEFLSVQVRSNGKSTSFTTRVSPNPGSFDGPESATVSEAKEGLSLFVNGGGAGYTYTPVVTVNGEEVHAAVEPVTVRSGQRFTVTLPEDIERGDTVSVDAHVTKVSNSTPEPADIAAHEIEITSDAPDVFPSVTTSEVTYTEGDDNGSIRLEGTTAPNENVLFRSLALMTSDNHTYYLKGDGLDDVVADENGDWSVDIPLSSEFGAQYRDEVFRKLSNTDDSLDKVGTGDTLSVQISSNGKYGNKFVSLNVEQQDVDPEITTSEITYTEGNDEGTIRIEGIATPNAEVETTNLMLYPTDGNSSYLIGDLPTAVADENGEWSMELSLSSTFGRPYSEVPVKKLSNTDDELDPVATGDEFRWTIRSNGEVFNRSIALNVEEVAAEPTVSFPEVENGEIERVTDEEARVKIAYTGAQVGDEIRVIVNGNTQTHGEGTYEAPATVESEDGEFYITLPADFLNSTESGTDETTDTLQVHVGETRNAITIQEFEADDENPASVSINLADEYSLEELAAHGLTFSGTAEANAEVTLNLVLATEGGARYGYTLPVTANAEGEWTLEVESDQVFTVMAEAQSAEGESSASTLALAVDARATAANVAAQVATTTTFEELAEAGADVELSISASSGDVTETATTLLVAPTAPDQTDTSTPDPSDSVTPSDDAGDDADERELMIEPKQINPEDFVQESAVSIAAAGCTPGTDATVRVVPQGTENVEGHSETRQVGDDGTVVFGVRGLNEDAAQSYVGTYQVTVECEGGEDLSGEFTVGDPVNAGSDDSGSNGSADEEASTGGSESKELPRTGGDVAGLVAGAALLVIGGATVMITRRRMSSRD